MAPEGAGPRGEAVRRCPGCDRRVHDLRALSDADLAAARATAPTCGVYTRRQLQRGGALPPEPSRWRSVVVAAGVTLGLTTASAAQTAPRTSVPGPVAEQTPDAPASTPATPTTLRGVVQTHGGQPLLGVAVRVDSSLALVGTLIADVTDAEGRFVLDVGPLLAVDPALDRVTVRVEYLGTTVAERRVLLSDGPQDLRIDVDVATARVDVEAVLSRAEPVYFAVADPEPEPGGLRGVWRWVKRRLGL